MSANMDASLPNQTEASGIGEWDRTIDRVQLIRRSIRCFYLGAGGMFPLIGFGLAIQAMRLHREVARELGRKWNAPPVRWYWVFGLVGVLGYLKLFGCAAGALVGLLFVGIQTYHLWRSLPADFQMNPADNHLRWGVILGYGGTFVSMLAVPLLLCALAHF